MRSAILLVTFPAFVMFAAEPQVTAPISVRDVRQIRKVLASATTDSVVGIAGVRTSEPISGAAPVSVHFAPDGRAITTYDRADLVWVMTARKGAHRMMYKLEKSAQGWKVVEKT